MPRFDSYDGYDRADADRRIAQLTAENALLKSQLAAIGVDFQNAVAEIRRLRGGNDATQATGHWPKDYEAFMATGKPAKID
jgi:hypothetical protein